MSSPHVFIVVLGRFLLLISDRYMKQKIIMTVGAIALVVLPVSTIAATYGYVNTQGTISLIEAPSATQALATAPHIDIHSGVILMRPGLSFGPIVATSTASSTTR
jgi:hypothetical protein